MFSLSRPDTWCGYTLVSGLVFLTFGTVQATPLLFNSKQFLVNSAIR